MSSWFVGHEGRSELTMMIELSGERVKDGE